MRSKVKVMTRPNMVKKEGGIEIDVSCQVQSNFITVGVLVYHSDVDDREYG